MSALARALRAYANRPPRIVFHAARSLARRPDETDSHGHLAAATGSSGGNSSLSSGQTRPLAARLGWPSRRAGNRFQLDSRSNPPPPPTPFAALAAAAAARSAGRSACSDKSGQEAASARDEAQVERAHLGPSTWRDVCFNRANRIGSDRIDACARGEVSRAEAIKGNFSALPPPTRLAPSPLAGGSLRPSRFRDGQSGARRHSSGPPLGRRHPWAAEGTIDH